MADIVDLDALTLGQQKECICIITESSARSARDCVAFADPEDNELRLIRLNSISQAVVTKDAKPASSLIRYSPFSYSLLDIVDGRPAPRDPAAFEEVFDKIRKLQQIHHDNEGYFSSIAFIRL